jgi:predicted transcriptional regulator of viral defense system
VKFELLGSPDFVVFTTREYAFRAGVAVASATRQLARAAERGAITRISRGIWANPSHPFFHPLTCVPKILGNEHGYVSFLTALHLRGVIEQIPRTMQAATTGHARRLVTPLGTFELFHIAPAQMRHGIEWSETRVPYRIATAEKALLDAFYISIRRARRFRSLPEIDWTRVKKTRFLALVDRIEDAHTASAVRRRFEDAWKTRPR